MDGELKVVIWATAGMLVGIFGSAIAVTAYPLLALFAAGTAGFCLAVLVIEFIEERLPELKLAWEELKAMEEARHGG